ncbi:hypothetical protein TGMAS_246950 [Toxoplasma gondii MAS]|uniref:Uncharacterized protein n=2 Tax=Toxoplasma gondii TaxID=5811 RepID=A0A086QU64_TOXGO|nr:hypothetical protein TGMAS_246950 [Toxoplasma gondii MAS]PUA90553.1 hypothetical protein TGBR9_246950 [Toxoplasma gondii TgCATBr9]
MDVSGRGFSGPLRSQATRARASQLVRPSTGARVAALRPLPDDSAKPSPLKTPQMSKINFHLEEETQPKDPAAAAIQALALEMREALQQLIARNRRLEAEVRQYRVSFKSLEEQKEAFARSFHSAQAELHKERQRSEFQEREFRALCAQLASTIQGFASDHQEIAYVCNPPHCVGGKGLRELHGLAQLLRVKLALGVYAHLRADKTGAEAQLQAPEALTSDARPVVGETRPQGRSESQEKRGPVVTVGEVRRAPAADAGRRDDAFRHSSADGESGRRGCAPAASRVSVLLNSEEIRPSSRPTSAPHSSRSCASQNQSGIAQASVESSTSLSQQVCGQASRETAESTQAQERKFGEAESGRLLNGDAAGARDGATREHVESDHESVSERSSHSSRSSESEFFSSSAGSSPRLSLRAPPAKSTRPKFVPCLSTAAAGAGSWMSGNREPSEYPQGM